MEKRFALSAALVAALSMVGAPTVFAQDDAEAAGVEPTLSGNDICAENAIMAVMRGRTPVDLSGNAVCEDVPLVFD